METCADPIQLFHEHLLLLQDAKGTCQILDLDRQGEEIGVLVTGSVAILYWSEYSLRLLLISRSKPSQVRTIPVTRNMIENDATKVDIPDIRSGLITKDGNHFITWMIDNNEYNVALYSIREWNVIAQVRLDQDFGWGLNGGEELFYQHDTLFLGHYAFHIDLDDPVHPLRYTMPSNVCICLLPELGVAVTTESKGSIFVRDLKKSGDKLVSNSQRLVVEELNAQLNVDYPNAKTIVHPCFIGQLRNGACLGRGRRAFHTNSVSFTLYDFAIPAAPVDSGDEVAAQVEPEEELARAKRIRPTPEEPDK